MSAGIGELSQQALLLPPSVQPQSCLSEKSLVQSCPPPPPPPAPQSSGSNPPLPAPFFKCNSIRLFWCPVVRACLLLLSGYPGLDATTALEVLISVRGLADMRRTVVVSLHQPSAEMFELFDTCLLLTRGGAPAYFGRADR